MLRTKCHVKVGDQVKVIAGKDKGKTGAVLDLYPRKSQVVVEGVRIIKKAVRKSEKHPNGGIIEKDGPIHISNVKKIGRPPPAPRLSQNPS